MRRGGVLESAGSSAIVPLRPEGTKPPLFLIHGVDGTLRPFQDLVRHLEPDQPVYGVRSQALLGEKFALTGVEDLAAYYIQAIQALHPRGPYHFLGYSFGGMLAFEMARQLRERGEEIGMLGMIDNLRMGPPPVAETLAQRLRRHVAERFKPFLGRRALSHIKEVFLSRILKPTYRLLRARGRPIPRFLCRAININWFAGENYVPRRSAGKITLFHARGSAGDPGATTDFWARLASQGVELHSIPGGHEDVLDEPNVGALAKILTRCLANVDRQMAPLPSHAFSAGRGRQSR
jgi:thioesterase domain-containing protein